MNTRTVHETVRLLPSNSVAYRANLPGLGRKTPNPPMAAHLRWGKAMNDYQGGWRVAMTHHASGEPLPPSFRDPSIRRAYRYLQGARDENMEIAHAIKASPDCTCMRQVIQGLLCAADISFEGIASWFEIETEVVELFEALFFNVRGRSAGYRAGVSFTQTRLGAMLEAEKDYHEVDLILMRAGQDFGWKTVARLAALIPPADPNESLDGVLADMEKMMAANARLLTQAGHANRPDSPGIRHGKALMMRPKKDTDHPQTDDDKVGLGSFGAKVAVLEHWRRISEPDIDYRLALRRQQIKQEQDAEAKRAAANQ